MICPPTRPAVPGIPRDWVRPDPPGDGAGHGGEAAQGEGLGGQGAGQAGQVVGQRAQGLRGGGSGSGGCSGAAVCHGAMMRDAGGENL